MSIPCARLRLPGPAPKIDAAGTGSPGSSGTGRAVREPGRWILFMLECSVSACRMQIIASRRRKIRIDLNPAAAIRADLSRQRGRMRRHQSRDGGHVWRPPAASTMSRSPASPRARRFTNMAARAGHYDPRESVLNAHNQAHDARNLFVTDAGACMASTSRESVVDLHGPDSPRGHAVDELKAGRT